MSLGLKVARFSSKFVVAKGSSGGLDGLSWSPDPAGELGFFTRRLWLFVLLLVDAPNLPSRVLRRRFQAALPVADMTGSGVGLGLDPAAQ